MMKHLIAIIFVLCLTGCEEDKPLSTVEKLENYMRDYERDGFSGSVIVAHKGALLLNDGYGFSNKQDQIRNTSKTIFDFGSLTKQFTGAAIVKAETLGLLTVVQELEDFFPNVPKDKGKITLHQLLTHSSGFTDALGHDYDLVNKEEFLNIAFLSPLEFSPGSTYAYSNVGYSLLGIILERVSGESYESFLTNHLFIPAEMEATGYNKVKASSFEDRVAGGYRNGDYDGKPTDKLWFNDGPGWHLKANGGILTSVEEMYDWINALNERKIFDDNALRKYLTPYVREDNESSYYSYGWVVDTSELGKVYWHDGGNGIFSAVACNFPESETIIIIASNDSTIEVYDLVYELISIIAAA